MNNLSDDEIIKIKIKTMNDKNFDFSVTLNMSIENLKHTIEKVYLFLIST